MRWLLLLMVTPILMGGDCSINASDGSGSVSYTDPEAQFSGVIVASAI